MASQFETGGNPPAPATFDAVLPRRDTPSGGTPAARMLDEVLRDWTQQRPRAPLSSVVSADGLIDFGPHDQTMPVSFHQSTDDRDESAPASPQRTLDSMLGSSDAAVQADGRQLQGMLNGTPEQRDLATAIIDNLSTNEARHRMLGILNDPQRREAAGQLSRMLRTPGDQFAAGELLDMLGSNNQTEQQDGRRLLDMLNNREQQALAQRLMGGLSVEGSARHQFLDMLNNPQQRQAAQEIAALLTSDDPLRTRAGATLINDLAGPGQTGRQDAERLMGMLRQEGTHDNALAILGNLSSPEQRHRMLEIMGNPENQGEHGASQRLLAMLRSDERQDGAAALLDLMNSRFPSEQQDGRRLLSMLNGGPQQQAMAERLLNIEDVERRHQLVNLAGNPRTAGAADALLQMRASRNRREGNAADRVLDLLESDSQADNRYGRDLAGLLSD